LTVTLALTAFAWSRPDANAQGPAASQVRNVRAARTRPAAPAAKVAVQPFEGPNTEPLRGLVARIVRDRGYEPLTSLPRYEGTGQYPLLAHDNQLVALVTADMADRGRWQSITFLVWNGSNGSVVGRWTASAPTPVLARAVGRGFWAHLGPAIRRAAKPKASPFSTPAPTMRIDASNPDDHARYATR
jgi:hypothetical protein